LKGEDAIAEHERRNGYDKEYGPGGVIQWKEGGRFENISTADRQVFVNVD
jgi:hypothetical protein